MEFEYGKKIRNAREKQGLSLEDISYELKINLKTLKKIEASQTGELPKAPFTKGFLKTYCVHLGVEPGIVIEEYEQSLDEPITNKLNKGVLQENDNSGNFFAFDFFKNQFLPIVILLMIVLGVAVVYSVLSKQGVDRNALILATPKNIKTVSNKIVVTRVVKAEEMSTENKEKIEKPMVDVSKLSRVATVYDGGAVVKESKEVSSVTPSVVFAHKLVVEPLADTYLYIKTNLDEKAIKAKLKPDVQRIFKFDQAEIKFLDAGAVNLVFDGDDIGSLGIFGETKKIDFPSMKEL